MFDRLFRKALKRAARPVVEGRPQFSPISAQLAEFEIVRHNLKMYGLDLARRAYESRPALEVAAPPPQPVRSKAAVDGDIESPWGLYWCRELTLAPLPHRKIWEYCWVLQTLRDWGALQPGARALAFGVGEEPLPSYFAKLGIDVVATDLAPDAVAGRGWAETGQHAGSMDKLFWPKIVDQDTFARRVRLEWADMTAIPETLRDFDICWSICALEHLGTIERGLAFIKNALQTLKPGGVAVHTTEFNIWDGETIAEGPTVLFQRRHFERIAAELTAAGHEVAALDFTLGDRPMDRFIDLPPYPGESSWRDADPRFTPADSISIKRAVYGFPSTCFGLAIRRGA